MKSYEKYITMLNNMSDKEIFELSVLAQTTICRGMIFNRNYDKIRIYMTGAEIDALNNFFNNNMSLSEAGSGYKLNMANVSRKLTNIITEYIL